MDPSSPAAARRLDHELTARRDVVAASLTLGVAVGVFGVVFGVGAVAAGGSVAQASVMSLLVFTGASQFSVVSVVAAGGSTAAALGGAMILAGRNAVYGLAMARVIGGSNSPGDSKGSLLRRAAAAQLTIDETTAMATAQDDPAAMRYAFWTTGITVYLCWNISTLIGALVGSAIDPVTYGLDVAIPAAYVAMVAPHLRHRLGLIAAIAGGVICVTLIPFTPVGVPILCAAAAILVGVRRPATRDNGEIPREPIIP